MSDPGGEQLDKLAADFTAAARLLQASSAEAAMVTLLPLGLAESELALRVHLMIAAGVLATVPLGLAAVEQLVAAGHDEPVDLLVDLAWLYARLDRSGG